MPNDKQSPRELKVTDKRIFTADGDIREEFLNEIRPAETEAPKTEAARPAAAPASDPAAERRQHDEPEQRPGGEDRRRTIQDKATNPGTPFTNFIEPLIAQGYMSLGMLRNPYQPQPAKIDTAAARQMIEILTLLRDKTRNNLEPDEEEFLETHLGELKLAFVQRTKTI